MLDLERLLDQLAERVAEKLREQPAPATKSRLLSVTEAAAYLGRSKPAIHRLVASGRLPAVRADRRIFLDIRDLDRFIEEHKRS